MSNDDRTFYTTGQIQAHDLHRDDMVLIGGRWRELFTVFYNGEQVLDEFYGAGSDRPSAEEDMERVDLACDRSDEGMRPDRAIGRPGADPVVFTGFAAPITVTGTATMPTRSIATIRTEVQVAALLSTGEYTAVRFVREEGSDGSHVDEGWAVWQKNALVTVQTPVR